MENGFSHLERRNPSSSPSLFASRSPPHSPLLAVRDPHIRDTRSAPARGNQSEKELKKKNIEIELSSFDLTSLLPNFNLFRSFFPVNFEKIKCRSDVTLISQHINKRNQLIDLVYFFSLNHWNLCFSCFRN